MKTYECVIKVGSTTTKVRVEAPNGHIARQLIEAQYGRDAVVGSPIPR
jgi:hypothetical protein